MTNLALSPTWIHAAACRDADPDLHDAVTADAARLARRICAGCPVRRECLTADLSSEDAPAGIRAGLDEDARDDVYRLYGVYRTAVAAQHAAVLAAAGRREAQGDRDGVYALRALAAAVERHADAVACHALAVAASVRRVELDAVREAHRDARAALMDARTAARMSGEDIETRRARMLLMAAAARAGEPTRTPALVSTPTQAADTARPSLAGAA